MLKQPDPGVFPPPPDPDQPGGEEPDCEMTSIERAKLIATGAKRENSPRGDKLWKHRLSARIGLQILL